MALSQEVLANIAFAEQMGFTKLHLYPPAQTRAMMKQWPPNPNPTPVASVIDQTIPGLHGEIPIRLYIPDGAGDFPVIAFFHGGGFVMMSIETHDEMARQLCKGTGALVMSVDYRLAPEHPYPAGPDDCVAATQWLIHHAADYKGNGTKAAVVGDSAGGYMALMTAQQLKAAGIALKAQVAAYPVTDHYSANSASYEENKEGYILSAEVMQWFWDQYVTDPALFAAASPLSTQNLASLAPALILTANYDPLRDEGKAYADKLKGAGVPVVYQNYENVHGFFGNGTPMGSQAMQQACDFLSERLNA